MKNNFLSLMGMRLRGRRMNDPEITRKSPGNHPVITPFSRLITSTLLLLFTFAIGNVWAACPEAGTIFKFATKSSLSGNTGITDNPVAITTENYLASFEGTTGSSLTAHNEGKKFQIASNGMKLADGAKSYLILNLGECTLKAGDIVKIKVTSQNVVLSTTANKSDAFLTIVKNNNEQTLSIENDVDESTIYLVTASNGAIVYSLEIIRPYTITLDAATNGGTVSTTTVKGAEGDKVVLPHAFKSGYKFKGWYTAASGGTKQANLYTVSGNATFVAQFEELPVSGEMFSLSMKSELKPAANCTLKSATGFATQVDMLTYATIEGGAAFFKNTSSNNHAIITATGAFNFAGSNAVMEIPLDFALQNGDEIQTDFSNKVLLSAATTKPSSGPNVNGSDKTYTIIESDGLKNATTLYLYTGSNGATATSIVITRPAPAATYTVTLNPAGGAITPVPSGWALTDGKYVKTSVEDGSSVDLLALTKDGYLLDGWKDSEDNTFTSSVTIDGAAVELTAQWAVKRTVSFAPNGGGSTMASQYYKAGATVTIPDCGFTPEDGDHAFTHWAISGVAGKTTGNPGETFTMPAGDVTLTAQWAASYGISKGTHTNGDFTIDPVLAAAGTEITLAATPDAGYLFDAWEVVKTSDATDAGVTVTNNKFEMPAFAVTVNATFVADTRKKILYLTSATTEGDKLYEALKDDYNVTVAAPEAQTLTNYDLVVLHESINGKTAVSSDNSNKKQVILDIPTTTIPVLNTKSYFYTSGRWNWGGAANGKKTKGMHVNTAYCNITSHPLFAGLTPDANDSIIILSTIASEGKPMQPVTSFSSGKEGYTLANVPDGCAIHELTPEQRVAASGKYLLISVFSKDLANLNANGQKLFQNAAAYLLSDASWTPVLLPTSPEIAGTTAYAAGGTIELTASATGESAATTYTWYKGATLEAAKGAGAIQTAKTVAENGNVYSKAECLVGDAGTYWCVISNGTDCEANASVEITVSDASYEVSFESAHGTAPSAGSGISYTLPELTESGYVHQGWTANIDVTVDEAVVTAGTTIANGKVASFGADVKFTAVWKQIFAVTFNLNGQSGSIDPQDIIDGEKATKPADPVVIGQEFGGWFTDAACTEGKEFDFNTAITETKELFAKWTAFDGCTLLVPATSGADPAVEDPISMQTGSKGGSMSVVGTPLSYSEYGLSFESNSSAKAKVTINNEIQEGTVISLTLVANGTSARGLHLYTGDGSSKVETLGWTSGVDKYTEATFTYIVKATDEALIGSNEFQLWRNNSVYLKKLTVTNCGDPIVYHNLTSAVNIAGKGTVTLGASSVREGYTTTAEYSDIDPAYEFVNWTVSGAGASIADASANPATITMGTEDAVVTLNLRLIPVKFTVNYFDGATAMGTEQVVVNEHPTASEIATAKRGYIFEGWAESATATTSDVIDLSTITSDVAATINLYAVYTEIPCPTSGTVYKFEIKDELPSENLPTSTDKDMTSYITATGYGYLTYTATANNKATINTDGTIQMKDASAAYLKVELECALAAGDQIRAHVTNNPIRVQVGTTYDSNKDLILAKNAYEFVAITSDMEDKQVLYITRSSNGNANLADFEIYRPAKYDVSFNMMGHGSAIADITNVIEGSKITAPTAPTDEDYSFAGWYKENTLENEWDFDVDVVEANTTLYAKWLDKSDATLKILKYGETEIALEAGVYTYAVELPSLTTAVPALTSETSNPNATAAVTNAAAFDGDGNASSTVEVTPEKEGAAHQTYTVNFTKLPSMPLLDVDNSIVWDFANAGTQNNTFTDEVLANFPGVTNDATFSAQTLKATGAKIKDGYLQGTPILFHATKAGLLRVEFANTGGSARPYRYLVVNGVRTAYKSNNTTHVTTAWIEVPAGDVTIEGECVEDENGTCSSNNLNFYKIEFLAVGHERTLVVGDLGTVCLPNASIARGVTVYEYQGADEIGKIVFDELGANELLVAGKPYIFQVNETNARFYYNTDPAIATPDNSTALKGNLSATITFDPGSAAAANVYFVKDHAFWMAKNTGVKIGQYRCYLQMDEVQPVSSPNPAPGRRRITLGVQGEQVATDIDQVPSDQVPSTKVIINGELFILRGEKMYDAKGQLVK